MTQILSTNILSPLGATTAENYKQVMQMGSRLQIYPDKFLSVEPFCASLFDNMELICGYTRFESLCIKSATDAIQNCNIDVQNKETIFVLSSTKGNIELLEKAEDPSLLLSAQKITNYFHNPNKPIVVSNACVSGVCAIITAQRLLESGLYRRAVVIGADVITRFVVAGFQSFKALSPTVCMPFDKNRQGLNLGEAAATMILEHTTNSQQGKVSILGGTIHNDANHISGPSRVGEGSCRCLQNMKAVLEKNGYQSPDFICLHGTATRYNDDMESIALLRANLQEVPVFSLKGYYGHTMGAAGILETIISVEAMYNNMLISTRGFVEAGTTENLNLNTEHKLLNSNSFIKLLSGFGGTNAAIAVCKR